MDKQSNNGECDQQTELHSGLSELKVTGSRQETYTLPIVLGLAESCLASRFRQSSITDRWMSLMHSPMPRGNIYFGSLYPYPTKVAAHNDSE